jgi:hypothetical protein
MKFNIANTKGTIIASFEIGPLCNNMGDEICEIFTDIHDVIRDAWDEFHRTVVKDEGLTDMEEAWDGRFISYLMSKYGFKLIPPIPITVRL